MPDSAEPGSFAAQSLERCDAPFLIIAGAAKAGTTSLFKYIATHPNICASRVKEPFYFLPQDIVRPLAGKDEIRYGRDPLAAYLALFPSAAPGQVRFEASPLYLLDPRSATAIHATLPEAHIVVCLREPISRLISHYRMLKLFGWIPRGISFDEYVEKAVAARDDPDAPPFFKYPPQEGIYTPGVSAFRRLFGPRNVIPVWFDELNRSPRDVVQSIVRRVGLDPHFYDEFEFRNYNPKRDARFPLLLKAYNRLLYQVRRGRTQWPFLRRFGRTRRLMQPVISRVLTRAPRPLRPSQSTLDYLYAYYQDDVSQLTQELGMAPPWADRYR